MVRHEVNTDNSRKWGLIIVPIKVEQINVNLFLDTYNSVASQISWGPLGRFGPGGPPGEIVIALGGRGPLVTLGPLDFVYPR